MNILVINGSPNKEKSITLMLTKSFLAGMNEEAEIINTVDLKINACKACYACWMCQTGCVQKDDATEVLQKIKDADLVIWSIPLYCYSVPAHCKALMDRTLSFNQAEMYVGEDGKAHHYGYEDGSKKTVLITSGGLPDIKGNFDGLVFQLRHMFGQQTPAICCAETGLFANPTTKQITDSYVELVKQAGTEYIQTGCISTETQNKLDGLMVPRDIYIKNINEVFANIKAGRY